MSALRIATRDGIVLVDLGPASARGTVHDGGRIARPETTTYRADSSARERVQRFREKHGGRKAR